MIRKTEPEQSFTLILSGFDELTEEIADAFYEACDDCTLGMSCGVAHVSFTRNAVTMKDAVLSAIADIRKVGRGIDVVRVESGGLLTQAEMARKLGKTRQTLCQYICGVRGPGGFPPPTRARSNGATGQSLWEWSDVARWLFRNGMAPKSLVEDAEAVATLNCVLDYHRRSKQQARLVRECSAALAGKRTA
jgi:hypothetical protein